MDGRTVRRYAQAATADELLTQVAKRGSELDAHTTYLAQRWQEGCMNAAWLAKELRDRGYRGTSCQSHLLASVDILLFGWHAFAHTARGPSRPRLRQM